MFASVFQHGLWLNPEQLIQNLVTILDQKFSDKWQIGRGVTPPNQTLAPLDPELNIDFEEE